MLDFKLQFYFEMFKDKPFKNAKVFKSEFIKKYGTFEDGCDCILIEELLEDKEVE